MYLEEVLHGREKNNVRPLFKLIPNIYLPVCQRQSTHWKQRTKTLLTCVVIPAIKGAYTCVNNVCVYDLLQLFSDNFIHYLLFYLGIVIYLPTFIIKFYFEILVLKLFSNFLWRGNSLLYLNFSSNFSHWILSSQLNKYFKAP